ncbi:hypothetical protein Vadar_004856 [Vaccinium darrowii]|uniref:Uncharacterized protein n=1 Tax=Vaccinium darrowii TaxID=229202 RepID=A0ACB7YBX1_9ERIC|nr:hypothetical protein Vadar_004856 [Vaccinium darrowii]
MGLEPNLLKSNFNHDLPIIKPLPHSFLIPNGAINHTNNQNPLLQISDNIEMVPLASLTYTSLRDLLPASPPASILWPTYNDRKDSWREIPIRDPLLQHAAWAYLQPMTAAREDDDRGFFRKLKDGCGGFLGCFGGFWNDVVSGSMRSENVDDSDD